MSRPPIAIRRRLWLSMLGLLSASYGLLIVNTELVIQRDRLQRHQRLVMTTATAIDARLAKAESASALEEVLRKELNDFSATRVLVWVSRPGQPPIFPQSNVIAQFWSNPSLLQAAGVNAVGMQSPRAFRFGDNTYYTCSMPLATGRGVLRFLEDVGVSPASRLDNRLLLFGVWLVLMLISALILRSLLQQAIQPLERLEKVLDEVNFAAARHSPLPLLHPERQPQELQPIVAAYNRLAARLEQSWQHQQMLIHSLSHELITPISLIIGNVSRILHHAAALPASDQKLLQDIRQEAKSSECLVRDLVDMARGETGHLQLSQEVFQPCELLDQLVVELRGLAWGDRLVWTGAEGCAPAAAGPLWVSGDPQRLRQCVLNLVENAAKYAPDGSPIRMTSSVTADRFHLLIQDQGPGISPQECERVFAPFTRLPETALQTSGSGIGLALVRLLMDAMGGSIELVKGSGVGTCFQLSLPLADPPQLA